MNVIEKLRFFIFADLRLYPDELKPSGARKSGASANKRAKRGTSSNTATARKTVKLSEVTEDDGRQEDEQSEKSENDDEGNENADAAELHDDEEGEEVTRLDYEMIRPR